MTPSPLHEPSASHPSIEPEVSPMDPELQDPNKEMRLLYLVSSYSGTSTGAGGHYYSVRDIAECVQAFNPTWSIRILTVGDVMPAALTTTSLPVEQVSPTGLRFHQFVRAVRAAGNEFEPTVVHSFDNKSHFFGRQIARASGAGVVLTRAGGPNTRAYFPYSPTVICFSEENLHALRRKRRLRSSDIQLLPQRIRPPRADESAIDELRRIHGDFLGDAKVLLRVCRIGSYYERSIRQTIELVSALNRRGIETRGLVVGTVEDERVLTALRDAAGDSISFVSDAAFTVDASRILPIADAVVGTGRSLVEAVLAGLPALVPVADQPVPVPLSDANLERLASTNFSERSISGEGAPTPTDPTTVFAPPSSMLIRLVESRYSAETAMTEYNRAYQSARPISRRPTDRALNAVAVHHALWSRTRTAKSSQPHAQRVP